VVVVLTAVAAVALLMMLAIVVDIGDSVQWHRQDQAAADAGALAAVQDLSISATVAQATAAQYAGTTIVAAGSVTPTAYTTGCPTGATCYTAGTATIQVTTPWSGDTLPNNAVHVQVCMPVTTFFAGLMNINSVSTCASATAHYTPAAASGADLLALNLLGNGLTISGGANLDLGAGTLQVNSSSISNNSNSAVVDGGNSTITAGAVDITGINSGACNGCAAQDIVCPTGVTCPAYGSLPAIDPLGVLGANVCPPDQAVGLCAPEYVSGPTISSSTCNNATLSPGIYTSGITVSGTCRLNAGVYVIEGTLKVSPGTLIGATASTGVLLYFTGNGKLDQEGGSQTSTPCAPTGSLIQLHPPTSGYYSTYGITMWQALSDTNKVTAHSSDMQLSGYLYAPGAPFDLQGGQNMYARAIGASFTIGGGHSCFGLDRSGSAHGGTGVFALTQ